MRAAAARVELASSPRAHARRAQIAVHLPTGSGKTLIAALLVVHYADAVVAASRRGGASRVVFLCPTKTLVEQQAGALRATVPLRVRSLTGDDGLDAWSAAQWAALLADAEVLVATPQCVVDALSKTFVQARRARRDATLRFRSPLRAADA